MLNDLKLNEAIEICIKIRDELPIKECRTLKERWLEKDALAILINYATKGRSKNAD